MDDKLCELGIEWSLKGILGEGEKMRDCCNALLEFLKNSGLEKQIKYST